MAATERNDPGPYCESETDLEDGPIGSSTNNTTISASASSSLDDWMSTRSDPTHGGHGFFPASKTTIDPAHHEDDFGRSLESQALTAILNTINSWAVKLDGRLKEKPTTTPPSHELDTIAASSTYDLSTKNLTYSIRTGRFAKSGPQKVLLNNITAEARHGEVLAIMGPSGASKTTLLDALAGRISRKSLSGSVLVNGKPMTGKFKRVSGYVMQNDAHFPMLTARENLLYGARLRLPSTMSFEEKQRRVEAILKLLGLRGCANTRIGNAEIGGVSNGERRRISIAMDLIHEPMVLFLDEPTSGLDSTSALQVMQSLQKLAKERSRTVVLTIHQPSYRILDTIDNSIVLAKGAVMYQGHHNDMIKFFSLMGFVKPNHVNVVEYMMDKIEEHTASGDLEQLQQLAHLAGMTETWDDVEISPMEGRDQRHLSSYDYKLDKNSNTLGLSVPQNYHIRDSRSGSAEGEVTTTFANSMPKETWILFQRSFKNATRTRLLFLSRAFVILMTSLILATLFFRSQRDWEGVQERKVFFAFTVAILVFTSCEAIPMFLTDRGIYIRETSRGAYRASSYVLASSVTILPFLLLLAILSSMSSYFAVGLVLKAGAILFHVLAAFMVLAVANAFVAFISGLIPSFIASLIIAEAAMCYQFLFSGFFLRRDTIPKYWRWLHYGSFFKYAYEALLVNEFRNLPGHIWGDKMTSENILAASSVDHGVKHQWLNVAYLACFYLGYRFMFYLTLRFRTSNIRH